MLDSAAWIPFLYAWSHEFLFWVRHGNSVGFVRPNGTVHNTDEQICIKSFSPLFVLNCSHNYMQEMSNFMILWWMNVSACYAMVSVIWSEVGPVGGMIEIVSNYFILLILKAFLFFWFFMHKSLLDNWPISHRWHCNLLQECCDGMM